MQQVPISGDIGGKKAAPAPLDTLRPGAAVVHRDGTRMSCRMQYEACSLHATG